jgi:uncharacterized membrane protein
MKTHDVLVTEYLQHLRTAAGDLPPDVREELVSNIAEHIATSLAELDNPSESDVRDLLDRLGEPASIAADARVLSDNATSANGQTSARPSKPGFLEWGGIVMLGLGSYVLPVVGTIAGLIMIALSPWWNRRQKFVAATLSLSGAIVMPLIAAGIFAAGPAEQGRNQPIANYIPVQTAPQSTPTR